jgi:hypothetical protein
MGCFPFDAGTLGLYPADPFLATAKMILVLGTEASVGYNFYSNELGVEKAPNPYPGVPHGIGRLSSIRS